MLLSGSQRGSEMGECERSRRRPSEAVRSLSMKIVVLVVLLLKVVVPPEEKVLVVGLGEEMVARGGGRAVLILKVVGVEARK